MLLNVLPQYKLEEKQDCLSQTHTVGELIYICKINLYILPGCNLKNWQCIAVDYQVWMWKNVKVDWTWKKYLIGSFYWYRLIPQQSLPKLKNTLVKTIFDLCHRFWSNWDLDTVNPSKWPSRPKFCERYVCSWWKYGQKLLWNCQMRKLSFSFQIRVYLNFEI